MLKFAGVCAQKQVLVQANTSLREVLIQLSQHLNEGGVHTGKHLFEGGVNTDCLNTVSTLIRGAWWEGRFALTPVLMDPSGASGIAF